MKLFKKMLLTVMVTIEMGFSAGMCCMFPPPAGDPAPVVAPGIVPAPAAQRALTQADINAVLVFNQLNLEGRSINDFCIGANGRVAFADGRAIVGNEAWIFPGYLSSIFYALQVKNAGLYEQASAAAAPLLVPAPAALAAQLVAQPPQQNQVQRGYFQRAWTRLTSFIPRRQAPVVVAAVHAQIAAPPLAGAAQQQQQNQGQAILVPANAALVVAQGNAGPAPLQQNQQQQQNQAPAARVAQQQKGFIEKLKEFGTDLSTFALCCSITEQLRPLAWLGLSSIPHWQSVPAETLKLLGILLPIIYLYYKGISTVKRVVQNNGKLAGCLTAATSIPFAYSPWTSICCALGWKGLCKVADKLVKLVK